MDPKENITKTPPLGELPFPVSKISGFPREVEEIMSAMSVEDQARCVMQLKGKQRQDLLLLSADAVEVTRAMPPEEIYQMVKEIGESDVLQTLSMVSMEQLQYIFDMEWWIGDRFQPKRALDWVKLMDRCGQPQLVHWFLTEEFEQKVMLLQALLRVRKEGDENEPDPELEQLPHFTPDGVYHIYFKVADYDEIKNVLLQIRADQQDLFFSLMEAIIWYPLTPTVEHAYRWRMTRSAERGIPDIEEALGVYSRLDPQSLKIDSSSLDEFNLDREHRLAPQYPLTQVSPDTFLLQCLSRVHAPERVDAIRWELVCLANKVMVADRQDPTVLENRNRVMRKVLGYVNIGFELGAEGDLEKGARLLERTWGQFLFQAGHEKLMEVKRQAERFLADHGKHAEWLLTPGEKEQMAALVVRFPQLGEFVEAGEPLHWRDFDSLAVVRQIETFLHRWNFFVRFSKHCLDLSETAMKNYLQEADIPESAHEMDLITWVTTALARFVLFKKISCEPLAEAAAVSFLEIIFLKRIFGDERKVCDEGLLQAFHKELLQIPMAWTDDDKKFLEVLIQKCTQNLEAQFGNLNLGDSIEWKYTHGLCIQL